MNTAIIIGNITKDLDLRKTANGKSVLKFTIAVNEKYGENKTTEYIDVTAWEKLADLIEAHCAKGSKLMVEGRIKTDSYEKNGQKIYDTYVVARNVEFLSPKPIEKREEIPLTGNDTDVMGFKVKEKIEIKDDDLPFY